MDRIERGRVEQIERPESAAPAEEGRDVAYVAHKVSHEIERPRASTQIAFARVATALATMATGALAIGAFAIGALAIRRLAIKALALGRARVGTLVLDEVEIGRLVVHEPVMLPIARRQRRALAVG